MIAFLETAEAREEALRMASAMLGSGSFSFPPSEDWPLSRLKPGTTFGVLVTEHKTLRAYSGTVTEDFSVPGYVPPCFSVNAYQRAVSMNDGYIHQLTERINEGADCLRIERERVTHETLSVINSLYSFSTWDGRRIGLPEKSPAGTGDCAGLRLINYALRKKLEIKGLAEFRLSPDGSVEFFPPCQERCGRLLPSMLGLDYLYADECFAVINKDAGLLSVPGRGEDKLDSASWRFHTLFPSSPAECAAHRLDMDTSGLLVLAFTRKAKSELNQQFERREVRKEYEALLEGVLTEREGTIDIPIRLDTDNRPFQIEDRVNGKRAVTDWKRLSVEVIDGEKYTRVRFYPRTGRTHQLRVHSALIGHPIKGDRLYGKRKEGERLALHAASISFTHPGTGKPVSFSSEAPF